MSPLSQYAHNLNSTLESSDPQHALDASRDFVDELTFANSMEIVAMLREVLSEDGPGLPPWARNLAYRLACLNRPYDPDLALEAAEDLMLHSPEKERAAEALFQRAEHIAF